MEAGAGITRRILAMFILANMVCASAEATLVSYWKLDESAGTIAYDSAGSNNGSLQNGPVWAPGKLDGALSFDGINDYVNIPYNSSLDLTSQATLSAWINTKSLTAPQGIVGRWNYAGGPPYKESILLEARGDVGRTIRFWISTNNQISGETCLSSIQQFNANTWYHVAGTYDGATMKLYINGQLENSTPKTGNIFVSDSNWCIGAFNYAGVAYFNGLIDDVRVYNTALSAAEIQQLYQSGMINAFNPFPSDGTIDVATNVVLSWSPANQAVSHNVYLGTSFNDVNDANTALPQYMGNQPLDDDSYSPAGLERGTTYYWRIDEIGSDGNTTKGCIWSFTANSFIGWWKLDETDGNVAHDSSGGNNGTLVNGPVWTTGKIAGALVFDGTDDYVEIPDANLNLTSQVTISAWINTKSRAARQAIVGQWDSSVSPAKESILLDARGDIDQKFSFSLSNDGTDATKYTVYSEQRFLPGTWYHVVGTYDGSAMKIYVNGQLENSTPATGNIFISSTKWIIGAFNSGTDAFFDGIIDDVRIYNRPLSADEVKQLFKEGEVESSFVDKDVATYDCFDFIDPAFWQFNVPDMIHIETLNDVETVRINIINYLWPTTGWPGSKMPQSVTTVYDPAHGINNSGWYQGLDNLSLVAKIEKLDVRMDHDIYGVDWHSYAYLLHPKTSINRLLIFHQGHADEILYPDCGSKELIDFFLEHGFSIMTFYMPLYGENVPSHYDSPYSSYFFCHDGVRDTLGESFIHVFLEPVFVGINYVKSQYNFLDISMAGLSGGGWTTHWCAALDTRISMSFPVAGSLPLYIMQKGAWGCYHEVGIDAEQGWSALYGVNWLDGDNSITSYLDLYIMGGYGKNREEVQILNQYETIYYGITYRTYEPYVRDIVEQLGQGAFSVYLNSTYSGHAIHPNAITDAIYPTMQLNFVGRQADFTGDGRVDIDDLAVFADAWLSRTGTDNWNENCDLFHDGQITILDFAEFAEYWLWQEN